MMDKSISSLEGKPEWPLIVQSVPCPVCNAPVDVRCVHVTMSNPMLASVGKDHGDWHAQRKQLAASIYYHNQDTPAPEPEKKKRRGKRK